MVYAQRIVVFVSRLYQNSRCFTENRVWEEKKLIEEPKKRWQLIMISQGNTLDEPKNGMVSVIVPVFNVKNYLHQCLSSIANQTYKNLEVLLIDDGSTDGSDVICKEYCQRDSRFHLVRQRNSGLGTARNRGLECATGTYVCFVDSDDYLHPEYVSLLLNNLIAEHADISMCSYQRFQSDLCQDDMSCIDFEEPVNQIEVLDRLALIRNISTTGPNNKSERTVVVWNKLMRRDWLGSLRFVDRLHEDEFMINNLIPKCEKAVFTSASLYYYRQRSSSIMSSERAQDIRHLDALDAYEQRLKLFHSKEYKSVYKGLVVSYLDNCVIIYHMVSSKRNTMFLKRKIYPRIVLHCLVGLPYLSKGKIREMMVFLLSPTRHKAKYWS